MHPRSNVNLSKEILESGGCLISELDWEMPAGMHTFPSRNRIIAGMSPRRLGDRSGGEKRNADNGRFGDAIQ